MADFTDPYHTRMPGSFSARFYTDFTPAHLFHSLFSCIGFSWELNLKQRKKSCTKGSNSPKWMGGDPRATVDTDPENMLEKTEPVRIFHNQIKTNFDFSDMVVVGVLNEDDPDGVFNPTALKHIFNSVRTPSRIF